MTRKRDHKNREITQQLAQMWNPNETLKVGNWAEVNTREDVLEVCLFYPTQNDLKTVEVDVCAVRCTNPIRITYDFERNGWSITRQIHFDDQTGESEWGEAAFLPYVPDMD